MKESLQEMHCVFQILHVGSERSKIRIGLQNQIQYTARQFSQYVLHRPLSQIVNTLRNRMVLVISLLV